MKYIWDSKIRKFVDPTTGEPMPETGSAVVKPMIVSDLPAYVSPLGTGIIDGRAARREDLKRNNCREVDPGEWKPNEKFLEREARKARA